MTTLTVSELREKAIDELAALERMARCSIERWLELGAYSVVRELSIMERALLAEQQRDQARELLQRIVRQREPVEYEEWEAARSLRCEIQRFLAPPAAKEET